AVLGTSRSLCLPLSALPSQPASASASSAPRKPFRIAGPSTKRTCRGLGPGKFLVLVVRNPHHGAFFSPVVVLEPPVGPAPPVFVSVFFVSPLPQPMTEIANAATRNRDRIFFTSNRPFRCDRRPQPPPDTHHPRPPS